MSWLFPAVLSTLIASLLLTAAYGYLYFSYRNRYLALWFAAWSIHSLRYIFLLLIISFGKTPLLYFINLSMIVISLYFLTMGTAEFIDKKVSWGWKLAFVLVLAFVAIAVFSNFSFLMLTVPLFGFFACVDIWVGYNILRSKFANGIGKKIVGCTFIIWGLHQADYPLLRPIEWFAPFGYMIGTTCTITIALGMLILFFERMRADLANKESHLRQLFEDATYGIALARPDTGIIVDCNRAFSSMLKREKSEIIGMKQKDLHPTEDHLDELNVSYKQHLNEKSGQPLEAKMLTGSGEVIDVEIKAGVVDLDGELHMQGFFKDISEQKNDKERLLKNQYYLEKAQEIAKMGTWDLDVINNRLVWTDENCRIFGVPPDSATNYELFLEKVHPEDRDYVNREWKAATNGKPYDIEHRIIVEGKIKWVREKADLTFDEKGNTISAIGFTQDITERKQAEENLSKIQADLQSIFDVSPGLICVANVRSGYFTKCNPVVMDILGYTKEEFTAQPLLEFIHPDDRKRTVEEVSKQLEGNPIAHFNNRYRCKDGSYKWLSWGGSEADKEGNVYAVATDITRLKQTEKELMESEEKVRMILDSATEGIYGLDHHGNCTFCNKSCLEMLGYESENDLIGRNMHDLIHYKTKDGALNPVEKCRIFDSFRVGEKIHLENEILWKADGTSFPVELWSSPTRYNGKITGAVISYIDITDRLKTEEEKINLESQLQQKQKIESIGHLAGGVAHDFNNILGVILGHAELALMKADPESPLTEDLEGIQAAAKRSADLTRQLLTFARKQTIAPKVIDLNGTIQGMLQMLQRLIGENIELTWTPKTALWPVKIDPSQLDQILANLCINARDAINNFGKISIETRNCSIGQSDQKADPEVQPGDYVCLSIADDGHGIDKELLNQVFDPFFTTKKFGRGTGLGLSTVYGAVKQNHGFIEVFSEPGGGAAFHIYLPRQKTSVEAVEERAVETLHRGTETVLLVEDDQMLLTLTKTMLEESGYTVLATSATDKAIAYAKEYSEQIQLLLSDVIMPDMNGKELWNILQEIRPEMKVIFMSGYTADIITPQGEVEKDIHFLPKPISFEALTTKLRKVLDPAF